MIFNQGILSYKSPGPCNGIYSGSGSCHMLLQHVVECGSVGARMQNTGKNQVNPFYKNTHLQGLIYYLEHWIRLFPIKHSTLPYHHQNQIFNMSFDREKTYPNYWTWQYSWLSFWKSWICRFCYAYELVEKGHFFPWAFTSTAVTTFYHNTVLIFIIFPTTLPGQGAYNKYYMGT